MKYLGRGTIEILIFTYNYITKQKYVGKYAISVFQSSLFPVHSCQYKDNYFVENVYLTLHIHV